jgi:hypothetical protein
VATAFVNWPTDLVARNPTEVLPNCYRDSIHGFYAWRNRWQDENDIVITALTQDTKGFMGEKADTVFHLLAYGEKITWGAIPGPVTRWERSADGKTSQLHFECGHVVIVDLSGKSGTDVLLIATGDYEGEQINMGEQVFTVKCFSQQKSPSVQIKGNRLKIGKQRIRFKNKQWFFY